MNKNKWALCSVCPVTAEKQLSAVDSYALDSVNYLNQILKRTVTLKITILRMCVPVLSDNCIG